ncbi:type IV inositol polyphosphate 5-phosphatase 11 [Impatiens glandulifera]|uniref:type IV inositol polyphosphate 5-phosphatase 11 n=1 Tax=Impatiens glandulifera TaxID=253017 RepID=UPI001FB0939B|nr:type IV inositol polyphosphate 5-phosphatase 11 [Impatiens glandulifera]
MKKLRSNSKGNLVSNDHDHDHDHDHDQVMKVHHEGIKTIGVQSTCCDFSGNNSDLCLCIVTWNMNGHVTYEDVEKIVGKNRGYDLLVVGLQEAVSKYNVITMFESVLSASHFLLGESTLQSLQLYVFGPKNSQMFVKELKRDKYATGGWGGMINRKKGAVAIRINYKAFRLEFISCHLSAHAKNVEERNSQLRDIRRALFAKDWNPYGRTSQVTIWLGDLNYRLEGINTFPARSLIHSDLHQMLTENDQLLQEAERGEIFNGYFEGTLAFKPTYKFDIGSSTYDTSHKVRVPSWTDRILFKIEDNNKIVASLHSYDSIDTVRSSDHKPVKAHLCLKERK